MGRPEKIPDDEASIGAQMRLARQSRAISLTAMSERLHRNKGHLSSVETGRLKTSQQLLNEYQEQTDVPLSHLLGGAAPQSPVQLRGGLGASGTSSQSDPQIDSAATCFLWATALEQVGQRQRAANLLPKAVQLPGDAIDFNNCAVVAERCGDPQLACQLYKRALQEDGEHTDIWINYADCLSAMANSSAGDEAEAFRIREVAEEIFGRLLEKELDASDRLKLLDLYLDHLIRTEQLSAALEILDQLQGLASNSLEGAKRYTAKVLAYPEKLGRSESHLLEMLRSSVEYLRSWEPQTLDPTARSEIARFLGRVASRLGDLKQPEFADVYIAAIELGLSDPATLGALGVDLHNRSMPSVALDIWRVGLTLNPTEKGLWSAVLRYLVQKAPGTALSILNTEDPAARLEALEQAFGKIDVQAAMNRALSVLRAGERLPPEPQHPGAETSKRTFDRIVKSQDSGIPVASAVPESGRSLSGSAIAFYGETLGRTVETAWLEEERGTIFAQYAGLWIGVVGEAVVAQGRSPAEVLSAARAAREAEPFIAFVPAEPIDHVHLWQTFTTR